MMTGKNIDRGKKCIEKACIQKLKMCNKHLFRLFVYYDARKAVTK